MISELTSKHELNRTSYDRISRAYDFLCDCRPIDVDRVLEKSRFAIIRRIETDIWSIPVTAAVALHSG
jgi:hypothetical protein